MCQELHRCACELRKRCKTDCIGLTAVSGGLQCCHFGHSDAFGRKDALRLITIHTGLGANVLQSFFQYVLLKLNEEQLKTVFKRASATAGLASNHRHELPCICGTLVIDAAVDEYAVSKILGHSPVSVTEKVYTHLRIDRMSEGLNKTFG